MIIKTGGDPSDFKVSYEGQDNLEIIEGALHITTTLGTIIEEKPFAYQETDGLKYKVACEYVLVGSEMHFSFPDGYELSKPVIIDPELTTAGGSNSIDYYAAATLNGLDGTGVTTEFMGVTRVNPPKMGAFEAEYFVWQGTTSTDFGTATNWVNGAVPPSGADITFAANLYPDQ